ncbi:hypothetical protein ACLKA7_002451 [Drosophila subpalustris]
MIGSARQADNSSLGGNLPFNNYLTVNLPINTIPEDRVLTTTTAFSRRPSLHMLSSTNRKLDVTFVESALDEFSHEEEIANTGWTTLTPQEIAIWIDRRARFVFPISFLVFNLFFWTFVYCI